MTPSEKPTPNKEQPPPSPAPLAEARQVIEEYAASLREIIKKLRRSLD